MDIKPPIVMPPIPMAPLTTMPTLVAPAQAPSPMPVGRPWPATRSPVAYRLPEGSRGRCPQKEFRNKAPKAKYPPQIAGPDILFGALFVSGQSSALQLTADGRAGGGSSGARILWGAAAVGGGTDGHDASAKPVIARDVADRIRDMVFNFLRGDTRRHSPRTPGAVNSSDTVKIRIDLDTGRILGAEDRADHEVAFEFRAIAGNNRLEFAEGAREDLASARDAAENPSHRVVFEGLIELVMDPVIVRETLVGMLDAPRADAHAIATAALNVARANERFVKEQCSGYATEFVGYGRQGRESQILTDFRVGALHLDASGMIIGSNVRLPVTTSPYGTVYSGAIAGAGAGIAAVMYKGKIVWYSESARQPLNEAQKSILREMIGQNTKLRAEMERHAPGALNDILESEGFEKIPESDLPQVIPSMHYFFTRYTMTLELYNKVFLHKFGFAFGNRQISALPDDECLGILADSFREFYNDVFSKRNQSLNNVKGLRQIIYMIETVKTRGYQVDVDAAHYRDAKSKLGLGDNFTETSSDIIPAEKIAGSDASAPRISLLALSGIRAARDYHIEGMRQVRVGRKGGNALAVDGNDGLGIKIEWNGSAWMATRCETDMYIDGKRRADSSEIRDGTIIEFGSTQILVRLPIR